MNIEIARLEPDVEIISPSGDLTKLEIKATDCDTIEEFFRSSSFGFQSVLDVTEHYPTTRFLFVNLRQQKITSISGPRIDPLNIDTQRQNWNEPWHWIEGLDTELQFNYWAENFIFDPLCLSAEKIISKLRQSSNKSDIRNLISELRRIENEKKKLMQKLQELSIASENLHHMITALENLVPVL